MCLIYIHIVCMRTKGMHMHDCAHIVQHVKLSTVHNVVGTKITYDNMVRSCTVLRYRI